MTWAHEQEPRAQSLLARRSLQECASRLLRHNVVSGPAGIEACAGKVTRSWPCRASFPASSLALSPFPSLSLIHI